MPTSRSVTNVLEDRSSLTIPANELRQYLQGLRMEILKDVDEKIYNAIDGLVGNLEHRQSEEVKDEKSKSRKDKKKLGSPDDLPPKTFVHRNSVLTDLWKVPHLESMYNICVAFFVLLIINTAIFYMCDSATMKKDIAVVLWAISQFHVVFIVWLFMNLGTLLIVYPTFCFWAQSRPLSRKAGFYDVIFLILFIAYQITLITLPMNAIVNYKIPPISAFIVLCEQTRIIMKTHAFIRENSSRALKYKPHQDGEKNNTKPYPDVQKLIYFMFIPTLVYRDEYPRTPVIRWRYVLWYFLQFLATIFCSFVPFSRFVVDIFQNTGKVPMTLVDFVLTLSLAVLVGALTMFLLFYGMLHAWMNLFAEMLRFGDRLFYQDWWNCTSFGKYYRTWNMVVYDWLYSYIYRDMYWLLGKSRVGSMLFVFVTSAIFHEYILAFTFGFLYPILFALFISFGVILVFVTRRKTSAVWNVFLWFSLFQGWGLLIVLYAMEWYSRVHCPRITNSFMDLIIPRSWTCNVVTLPWR